MTFSQTEIEMKADSLVRELDELVALAANPDTSGMIAAESLTIGQIYSRASLLQSFLIAAQVPALRVVKNG